MIVMKFGGTSVGTAERLLTACQLVRDNLAKRPLVVVSAHNSEKYRMTDTIIESAHKALGGNPDSSKIRELQFGICEDLNVNVEIISPFLEELDTLLTGIRMIREISPQTMDLVMSFGERMCAVVFTEVLKNRYSLNAVCVPSFELGLRTDNRFGSASPDKSCFSDIAGNVSQINADVIVTTGFIGISPAGQITTLGRGGSDLSATLFGAALKADEVQLWTDVDGVMTADPRVVKDAKSVPELSFVEAAEIAWYGAKVLHPLSMLPAIENDIPVRVLNTAKPKSEGTLIIPELKKPQELAKSIVYMKGIILITITTPKMLGAHGFLARAFGIFAKYEIDIHMIATSEISFSLTIPGNAAQDVESATKEIKEFADVIVEYNKAVVCLIGENMSGKIGVAARVMNAVSKAGVNIRMISQDAREYNIALLIEEDDVAKAVTSLHNEFFIET
ncbi:aspartate kinase [bacterium]|nr:aspartate kinase [bacterium]MBU1025938.1 aspartate kinase [bacterium]